MAVELGVAYISLVPSAKGIADKVRAELGAPLERAARESGADAGDAFAAKFRQSSTAGLGKAASSFVQPLAQTGRTAGAQAGDSFTDAFRSAADADLPDLTGQAADGGGAAGRKFGGAFETEAATAAAATDLTGPLARSGGEAGDRAGRTFASAFQQQAATTAGTSGQTIASTISTEIGAADIGTKAGGELGAEFAGSFAAEVGARKIGAQAGGNVGEEFATSFSAEVAARRVGSRAGNVAASDFVTSFADRAKDGVSKVGIGLGLALTKGFVDSMSIEQGNDKLTAQLALTKVQAKEAGKASGDLYTAAYGDSLGQVNEAISKVQQNIGGFRGASEEDLEKVTAKVLDIATAFDQDLGGVTAAVGQLMKTGLAANADDALDIITVGFQKGVNKADDLLDTVGEYSTQFRKMGIDGRTATGILSQGLQAGARDADVVADAIKEFSIRAIDGSELTKAGFDKLGLSSQRMAQQIAGGGPSAANALQVTLDRLRQIEDPALRAQAAVELFGTQAEDLGEALFAIDPSTAVAGLGQVTGAAERMGIELNTNTASTLDSLKRRLETTFAGIGGALGPVLSIAPALGGLALTADAAGPALTRAGTGILGVVRAAGLLKTTLVVGGVTGAVALLAVGIDALATSSARAKAKVGEITKDLKTNDVESYGSAIAEATRRVDVLIAAKPKGGFFTELFQNFGPAKNTLADYGVELDKTIRTTDELKEAQGRVMAALDALRKPLGLTNDDIIRLANSAGIDLSQAFNNDMIKALQAAQVEAARAGVNTRDLAAAQDVLGSKVTTAAERLEGLETALDSTLGVHLEAVTATSNLKEANVDLAEAYADTGDEAAIAANKLDAFKTSLDKTLGVQLNAYDAATALATANDRLAEAFAEAKGTADPKTKEGRGLRDALSGQIEATEAEIAALVESGALTAEQGTDVFIKRLEELKKKYPALAGSVDTFLRKLREAPAIFKSTIDKTDLAGEANRRLTSALAAEVKAFDEQQRSLIAAGGLTAEAGARVNGYVNHLQGLKAKYPELAPVIDGFIAKVREIPVTPEVKPTVNAKPAVDGVDALKAKILPDLKALSVTITPGLNPKPALDAAAQLRAQILADFGGIGITLTPVPGGLNGLPGREHGGPVLPGRSYIVGEKRAEVLTMGRTGGHIDPEVPGGGGGPAMPIHVDARGMQRPEEVGDYVARNVGFLLAVAGVPVTD